MVLLLLLALSTVFSCIQMTISDYSQTTNWNGEKFDLSSLEYVTVISRHGSRSPYWSYPKDCCPYNDSRFWPDGIVQLTEYGKKQSYESGIRFRQRYNGFIKAVYFPNETMFLSNVDDRELCSAQLIAAGMFPPTGFQIWNEHLLWQPISIYPVIEDSLQTKSSCPKFVEMSDEVMETLFEELAKDNAEFIQEMAYFTGLEPATILPVMFNIWQSLELERENGYPIPEWADVKFLNRLYGLSARIVRESLAGTQDMKNMIAGPVLSQIVQELNNKSRSALIPNRKMTVFVSHDTTIIAALIGLEIDEPLLPPTTSALAFELHRSKNGPIVQVLYFNHSSTERPTLFDVPGCPNPCPLEKFTEVASRYIPRNFQINCTVIDRTKSRGTNLHFSMAVLIPLIINLILVTIKTI